MNASLVKGQGVTLAASAARTTSSNTGSLKNTTNNLPQGSAVSLFLSVTANAGDDAGTVGLDVYVDTSPDGGTTWYMIEKFAKVVSSTAVQVINFRSTGIGATEAAAQSWIMTTTTSIAVATNTVMSEDVRVRWTLGNSSSPTVAPSATFAVQANVQPMGTTF